MKEYIGILKILKRDANLTRFRSLRQKLIWLSNTKPDISCAIGKITQVTDEKFVRDQDKHVKTLNIIWCTSEKAFA